MSGAVLITGATSGIGRALARQLAAADHPLVLAGRAESELERLADDLRIRLDATVQTRVFDARAFDTHDAFFESCLTAYDDGLEGVIVCHGYLGDQAVAQRDPEEARAIHEINCTSCVGILERAAAALEARGRGFLCGVSSVAGDRGRQSNYLYGAAKAGLSTYLDGLRHRLAPMRIPVTAVRPGFVDTATTYGLPGLFLVATPERVAAEIIRAIRRRRATIYTPWFWRYIMMVIRLVPGPIFRRTRL